MPTLECSEDEWFYFGRCIDDGQFQFVLTWEGDDELDLYAQGPGGSLIYFGNTFDPVTGGRLGEDPNQDGFGMHVENIYWPDTAPPGIYEFFVVPFNQVGDADTWTVTIFGLQQEIGSSSGTGISETFTFNYDP